MAKKKRQANTWELHSGLFEVFWKRGPKGLYADRVRICGSEFFYISGKKASTPESELPERKERKHGR